MKLTWLEVLLIAAGGILVAAASGYSLIRAQAAHNKVESPKAAPVRLVMSGSSTMAPLIKAMGRRFQAMHPEVEFNVQTGGSSRALVDVREGKATIGMYGRAMTEAERDVFGIPIARDGVCIVVHQSLRRDPANPQMEFTIVDSGIGMTPVQLAGLFRPFEQADSSTTRQFGGTGLGLSICKRLAQMLGGDITVQSELHSGSRFTLTISTGDLTDVPLLHDAKEVVKPVETAMPVSRPQAIHLDCRVLLAEDGLHNQKVIRFYLEKAGAQVVVADNGRIALEMAMSALAAGQPFDVILMDMQMPEMDGYTATATLRSRGYEGPIIALTAHAMEAERGKCMKAGCTNYVSKPVDKDLLIATVASYPQRLCHEEAGAAATESPAQPQPLRSTMEDDPDLRSYLSSFIADLPRFVSGHETCLADKNLDEIRRLAHQLKGAGGTFGFNLITEAARCVETSIESEPDLTAAVTQLLALIRRVEGYEPAKEMAGAAA
jgi:CheY-like chemotaxis protein/HPt (histidine-containing phosphotransfer) domain-containing protein